MDASGFWSGQRVCVTGGAGFLGSYVVARLRQQGCADVFVPRSVEFDLRGLNAVSRLYDLARPDIVLHLAAKVGGIGANRANPGRFFYDNVVMGVQLIEEACRRQIKKFVALGTVCAYPKHTPVPFHEEYLWNGYPEETNAPYGLAKKMLLVQCQAYREQYGFNSIFLLPANLYGPRDHFDLESSHVIPALIRKCAEAVAGGVRQVHVWGTGTATRDFLHVDDCARAILLAAERYDSSEPVNIGSGREMSVRKIAEMVAALTGFGGDFVWDSSKPDGQPRRCLDVSRATEKFGFTAEIAFEAGLRDTVAWYHLNRKALI